MSYDVTKLDIKHSLYWMEDLVKEVFPSLEEHSVEHFAMMKHWNISYRNEVPLNGPYNFTAGTYLHDRALHLLWHLKYWEEKEINKKYVDRYNSENAEEFGALKDLPLPAVV